MATFKWIPLTRIVALLLLALPLAGQPAQAQNDDIARRVAAVQAMASKGPRALGALKRALGDRRPQVRKAAAEVMGSLGAAAVPALVKALHVKRSAQLASQTLVKLGPRALPALGRVLVGRSAKDRRALLAVLEALDHAAAPLLLSALGHKDAVIKKRAAELIAVQLGPSPEYISYYEKAAMKAMQRGRKRVYTSLMTGQEIRLKLALLGYLSRTSELDVPGWLKQPITRATRDADPRVRKAALELTLKKLAGELEDPAILRSALGADDLRLKLAALKALSEGSVRAAWVGPAVEAALKHRDARVRSAALATLKIDNRNKAHVTRALLQALKDRAAKVRKQAVEILESLNDPNQGSAGPFDALVVPALVRALDDRSAAVRGAVCSALYNAYAAAAEGAEPALRRRLNDPQAKVRVAALWALGTSAANVAAITRRIRDRDREVREAAVVILGRVTSEHRAAIPALKRALKDRDATVRARAAEGLVSALPVDPSLLPLAIAALKDKEHTVRRWAALGFRDLDKVPPAALPTLVQTLTDRGSAATFAKGALEQEGQRAVPILVAALRQESAALRPKAVQVLAEMGPKAAAAVPQLDRALAAPEEALRRSAAEALGKIGPAAAKAVPGLVLALNDKDDGVARAAAQALGRIGPSADAATPALQLAMRSKRYGLGRAAAVALGGLGGARALNVILDAFEAEARAWVKGRRPPATSRSQQALESVGPAAVSVLGRLRRLLRSESVKARRSVVTALGRIGPRAASTLCLALTDRSAAIRSQARRALVKLGPVALAPLARALSDPRHKGKLAVVATLGELLRPWPARFNRHSMPLWKREKGMRAVERALVAALQRPDRKLSKAALQVLTAIKGRVDPPLASVIRALGLRDKATRLAAAKLAAKMGGRAAAAAPALTRALRDKDSKIRESAASALGDIGRAAAIPALRAALRQDRALAVKAAAARSLGQLGQRKGTCQACLQDLKPLLRHKELKPAALDALRTMGPRAASLLPVLVGLLEDPDDEIRRQTAAVLEAMGPAAAAAAPALVKALELEPNVSTMSHLISALKTVGVRTAPVVKALSLALQEGDKHVRAHAAAALGALHGQAARAAIPLLRGFLEAEEEVAIHAAAALFRMGLKKEALPVLERELKRGGFEKYVALGAIGAALPTYIPKLRGALKSDVCFMRHVAVVILGKIGPAARGAVPDLQRVRRSLTCDLEGPADRALRRIRK